MSDTVTAGPEAVDLMIDAWYVVTMNPTRDIIHRGSVAVRDGEIVAVGKTADLEARYLATERIGGERFVVTPGMINTHIHITGEPLTRGYVPDDTPFEENVFVWLTNLYASHRGRRRALLGAAGRARDAPQRHHDVPRGGHDPLPRRGLRRADRRSASAGASALGCGTCRPSPTCTGRTPTRRSHASRTSSNGTATSPTGALPHGRPSSGHTTCSDPLWRAARALADEHGVGMSFHMSPAAIGPRRVHRRVRPAADGPPRRTRRAGRRRCAHALRARRRQRDRRDWRACAARASLTARPPR